MEIASIPITTCSKEHQQIYQEWFNYADADTDGRITGNDATKFFAMSNLSRQDLKQVWTIADSKRQGYLGFKEFIAAMQLVSLAQAGHAVTHDLLNSDVDLSSLKPPVMEGLDALIAKKKRKEKTSELESNGSLHGPSPSANWFSSKSAKNMSDTMHDDIDDGLRFRNCNCFCGLKASVKISDMRNENRYRLFQCCPKDACRFFQWCIPLKTPLSYAEDFQQLQEELCVLREELRVIHDKVHPLDQPKKMAKIRFIAWCLFCTALALLLTMTMV